MSVSSGMEGQVLAGKYRVERVLGQGGMGIVLAARHVHLEERVAVKLMLADAAFDTEAVARFLREARAAARLESAHVARVSDVGTLEDGRPYMVMEYLHGSDLSQLLAASGPLAIRDAVDYLLQAAEAIAEAHSIGIVHRDLKPSNLFLTRRRDRTPHVKVLDFGISKVAAAVGSTDNAMTQTSAMMGSPLYMSPEQMTSVRDVDGRSDIWAMGIILFELISGSVPFMGETLPQVCGLVLQTEAPLLSSRRAEVPAELDAIVARCLAKSPGRRYQSVAELAVALRGLAGRPGRASVERILMLAGEEEPAPSATPKIGSETVSDAEVQGAIVIRGTHAAWGETKAPLPAKSRPSAMLLASLVLVPLLGVAGWWALRAHQDPSPSPEGSVTVVTGTEPAPSAPLEPAPSAVPISSSAISTESAAPSAPPLAQPPRRVPPIAKSDRLAASPASKLTVSDALRDKAMSASSSPASNAAQAVAPDVRAKKSKCEPNFYFDAQGEKHFKPECF